MSFKSHDADRKHARRIRKRIEAVNARLSLIISSEFGHFEGQDYDALTKAEAHLANVVNRLRRFGGDGP